MPDKDEHLKMRAIQYATLLLLAGLLLTGCGTTGTEPVRDAVPVAKPATATTEPSPVTGAPDLCQHGQRQSPIDIGLVEPRPLMPLRLNYRPGSLSWVPDRPRPTFAVENGGHIELYGQRYQLYEISVVAPSEHAAGGERHAAEIQALHRSAGGEIAAIGMALVVGEQTNPLVQLAEQADGQSPLGPFDAGVLFPAGDTIGSYRAYTGSLTLPPCTENVRWVLLNAAGELSADQQAWLGRHYPDAARALQPANERTVYLAE